MGRAIRTRSLSRDPTDDSIGKEIEIIYGEVRGMTDNGQPGWLEGNYSGYGFSTQDEARKVFERNGPSNMWGFDAIKDSGFVRKIVTRTRIDTEIEDF